MSLEVVPWAQTVPMPQPLVPLLVLPEQPRAWHHVLAI